MNTRIRELDYNRNEEILKQILKTNVELIEKINVMSRELVQFKEISRLITEIHKLHFQKMN